MSSEITQRFPDWKLERYLLDELPAHEAARIRDALEVDESLRERLKVLERSNQELRDRYSRDWMSHQIRRKLGAEVAHGREPKLSAYDRLRPLWVPAAAAVLVTLIALPFFRPSDEGSDGLRTKGDARIMLFRKTDTGSERLEKGAICRHGDVILVQYRATGRAFGAILSIDGRGTITMHLPTEGPLASRLQQNERVSLDFAFELDDAPDSETFYLVTSNSPFALDVVMQAARSAVKDRSTHAVPLSLPEGLTQSIFPLKKESSDE